MRILLMSYLLLGRISSLKDKTRLLLLWVGWVVTLYSLEFTHITYAVRPMHIFMARSRVSKSRLKAELCFQRNVHFACDPKCPTTLKPKYIQYPEGKNLLVPPCHEGIFVFHSSLWIYLYAYIYLDKCFTFTTSFNCSMGGEDI